MSVLVKAIQRSAGRLYCSLANTRARTSNCRNNQFWGATMSPTSTWYFVSSSFSYTTLIHWSMISGDPYQGLSVPPPRGL